MWFKKKEKFELTREQKEEIEVCIKKERTARILRDIEDMSGENDTESCTKCGCVVKKIFMKSVQVQNIVTIVAQIYNVDFPTSEIYYCTRCAPVYDRVFTTWDKENKEIKLYSCRVPEHYIAVTEEGEEVKNVPSKNKK